MTDSATSLLAVGAIILAAYGSGRPLWRGLRLENGDRLESTVWSAALGLVAAGLVLATLGLAGLLYRPLIGGLTVVAAVWGMAAAWRQWSPRASMFPPPSGVSWARSRATFRQSHDALWPVPPEAAPKAAALSRGIPLALGTAAGLAALASLVAALAPPTAGDAMCYHLELPKVFLAEHALVDVPDSDNSVFPLLTEMWFLWGLALDGGVAAQLIHWALGLLLAAAAAVLATPILGRTWRWSAGCIVLLTPGISNQMTAPLNDLSLAAFCTLALAAWVRALASEEAGAWRIVAGVMLGGALGIKHLALVFVAAAGCVWLWTLWRQPAQRRALLASACTVAIVAASFSGVWYVRAAWLRGNPVYPFCNAFFPGAAAAHEPGDKTPLGWQPREAMVAPWHIIMRPERFGGSGHQLGPLFLAAIPGLIFARRLRGLPPLLAMALIYCLLWYGLRQNVRFLFPLAPVWAIAATWAGLELRRFPRAAAALAAAGLGAMLLLGVAAPIKRAADKLAVAAGWESRAEYLYRVEPTFHAALWANAICRPGDRLLTQDYRAFYFGLPASRENVYRRRTGYDQRLAPGADVGGALRQAGFSHLLLAESLNDAGPRYDPTLLRLVEAQQAREDRWPAEEQAYQLLTEYRFVDADGGCRQYRLLKLR